MTDIAELERCCLGSLLLAAADGTKPETCLRADDFLDEQHKRIFTVILNQYDAGILPDIITVTRELPEISPGLIAGLTNTVPSAVNRPYYETQISSESRKRRFVREAETALAKAQEPGADVDGIIGALAEALYEAETVPADRKRYADWEGYVRDCTDYDPSKDFSLFSEVRCPNGTLSYIGARPGGGKTTMMINLVRDALSQGRRAFFVNLEMSNKQIMTNLILSSMYAAQGETLAAVEHPLSGYYGLFKEGGTGSAEFVKARQAAMEALSGSIGKTLFIYDGIGNTLNGIFMSIRAHTRPGDVVLIDYVQRLPVAASSQRYLEIKAASNALLQLAVRNGLVIIAGAQLNRKAEDGEASLADFREGGDIEADAHNALAIERDYIRVLKAREGESGQRVTLDWKKAYCYMQAAGVYGGCKPRKAQPVFPSKDGTGTGADFDWSTV